MKTQVYSSEGPVYAFPDLHVFMMLQIGSEVPVLDQ